MIGAVLALHRRRTRLDRAFSATKSVVDVEQQALLVQLLCIQVSGFIEQSIKDAFAEFARTYSRPEIGQFAGVRLRRYRNFNSHRLITLVREFSTPWGESFETFLTDRLRNSIDSIYNIRNSISHGIDVGVGLVQMIEYYEDVSKVVGFVFDNMLGLVPH